MKKVIFAAVSGLAMMSAQSAYAADGQITITGEVVDAACDIAVNGGVSDATVQLPTISKTALANAGDIAGSTPVMMSLSNCPASGAVRAFFEAMNVDQSTGNLQNLGSAQNVQVQFANPAGAAIDMRDQSQNMFTSFVDNAGVGSADIQYTVQYVATDAAVAGTVATVASYNPLAADPVLLPYFFRWISIDKPSLAAVFSAVASVFLRKSL
ncbi:fimbrial protein [Aeromonas veronii]|uniref:fimbrial protein n=1 Tax=Aeromonas veronii TaxID=654 RepID=UPI0032ECD366